MKETVFIHRYKEKWQDLENYLQRKGSRDPDYLSSLYVQLTDDLSYAKTHYPDSKVTIYLNQLSSRLHSEIYKNKKENRNRFVTFWTNELPITIFQCRKQVLVSFLGLVIAFCIGWVSAANDDGFVRMVLGDGYVDQTQQNIDDGDPMGIYDQGTAFSLSMQLMTHNIRVCLLYFTLGIFFGIGSLWAIVMNGVRIGAFMYMFYAQDVVGDAIIALWMHGTFEITVMVFSGAAGMVLGSSFLFTGTYTRLESLKRGAVQGLKIIFGVVPFLIIAGFIEGTLTRHYQNYLLGLTVILLSLGFVISYFVIYPFIMGFRFRKTSAEGFTYGYEYPEHRIKLVVGALWLIGGLGATIATLSAGERFGVVFTGAIATGIAKIIQGLMALGKWKEQKRRMQVRSN